MPIAKFKDNETGEVIEVSYIEGESEEQILARASDAVEGKSDPGFSGMEMAKNFPGSFGGQISELAEAVSHPIDTLTNLGQVAYGALGKIPGIEASPEATAKADAVGNYYKNRYTDWDAFLTYLEEDPAAVLGDASMALTGFGGVLPKVGKFGAAIDPVNMAKNAIVSPARYLGSKTAAPVRMQQNAMMIDSPELAEFTLKHGYTPTEAGYAKFQDDIANAQSKFDQATQSNPQVAAINNKLQQIEIVKQQTMINGDLAPKIERALDAQSAALKNQRKAISAQDPNISQSLAELAEFKKVHDVIEKAKGRAQRNTGNLRVDLGVPTVMGSGTGALAAGLGMSPTASIALGGGILAASSILTTPVRTSRIANAMFNSNTPFTGAAENNLMVSITHQAIRDIGNEETRGLLMDPSVAP